MINNKILNKNSFGIPHNLLQYLQEAYPDKTPRWELSLFELGRLAGQQDVIQNLTTLKDRENV